jgi:aquaporin Z
MKKFIVELIGTFFLVFTVLTCVTNPVEGVIAPIAIGGVLMVMIFAGGHISGGHFNPAVTIGVAVRGRLPSAEIPLYILAQLAGAVFGAGAAYYLKGLPPALSDSGFGSGQLVLSEFIFTFGLVYVVLNVATAKANAGNSFYGLAIGSTVMVGAFTVGPISGGVFNPAVATGLLYMGLLSVGNYMAYVTTQFSAGVLAAYVFRILNPEDK